MQDIETSARLAAFRAESGLSLDRLAKRAKVTKQFLSLVETGASDINVSKLARVCKALDISLHTFFGPLPKAGAS